MEMDRVFAAPASIARRATTGTLLDLAKRGSAVDPTVFDETPPFFWLAEISSSRVDVFYTQMRESTLRNFADEAAAGVSFQNSHTTDTLGFGRSLTGQFFGPGGNGVMRVEADFYTIPGLRLHDVSTDDFIRGVRAGVLVDVSVGFYGGSLPCSICGRDMVRDWDCCHVPGLRYDTRDDAQLVVHNDIAIGYVEDAHLAEVSVVYDGATPGASIVKAQQEALNGRMPPESIRLIENRYRINLPTRRVVVPGIAIEERMPKPMNTPVEAVVAPVVAPAVVAVAVTELVPEPVAERVPTDEVTELELVEGLALVNAELEQVRGILLANGETATDVSGAVLRMSQRAQLSTSLEEQNRQGGLARAQLEQTIVDLQRDLNAVRAVLGSGDAPLGVRVQVLVDQVRQANQDIATMQPLVADGRSYRDDMVNEAMVQGVRAFGADFSADTYRAVLQSADMSTVRQMRNDWRTLGDRQFATGRATVDGGPPAALPETATPAITPDAYRA